MEEPKMYIKPGGIPYFLYDMASYPEEGGSLLHIVGTDIWYKGQPNMSQVIFSLDLLKRLLKLSMKFVGKNPIKIIGVLLNWKKLMSIFHELGEVSLRRHGIILERFCVSARELIRVTDKMTTEAREKNPWMKDTSLYIEYDKKMLDFLEFFMLIITFYEFDMAYRWRSQFALNILNKDLFAKNPYLEVRRILTEMNRREKDESIKEKYRLLDKLVWIFKIPRVKKLAKKFVEELDMSKIIFDEEDRKWLKIGKEFDFS